MNSFFTNFTRAALMLGFVLLINTNLLAQPAVPVLSAPADGATGQSLTPALSWGSVLGATVYRVQLASDAGFTSILADTVTAATSYAVYTGLTNFTQYYWQVKAFDGTDSSAFSAAFSFRTELDVPVLAAPANNATAQSLTPALSWGSVTGATGYRVQLATDVAFTAIIKDTVTAGLGYNVYAPLANYTGHYWRVKAVDGVEEGAYSAAFAFRTELAAPVLNAPANNSIFASLTPTISWNAVPGATAYDIQVASDVNFIGLALVHTGETSTSYTLPNPLDHYTVYYWRVRATDGSETTSYSPAFTFRTLITTPVLSSPADGAIVQPVNAAFDWDDVTGATSYRVQVATDAGFTNIVRNIIGIGSSAHTLSAALDYYTVYYWRVSAFDGVHETVASSAWSFETEIDAPDLVSPGWLTPGNSIHPTLVWRTVDGADNYRAQFSALSDFSVLMYDSVMTDTTLYIDSILANNTLYYWRVYAENDNPDVSPWSSSVFRTVTEVIPYLTHPINNHLVYTLDPTVHWNINVSGVGISYDVQYSVDSTFPSALTTTLDAGSAITDTLFGLLPATQYFWRVRSKNSTAIITYSAHNSFTTFGEVNTIPTQSWPIGGATVYSLAPNLYWYLGVTSFGYTYEIRYKEVSSGTWSADLSAGTSLTYALSGLTPGTEYEWQVRSLNGIDTSDWSASATFTTYSSSAVTAVKPYISYPTSGVMVYSLMPTLYWWIGQSHAGLTFDVEVYTDTTGAAVHTASGITDINYQTSVLLPGTTYYFRVRSDNGSTQSDWTYFESFVTFGVTGQIQPILSYPIGGQIIYSYSTTLHWYMVGSADTVTYELQFKANDSSFSSTIALDTTSYSATSLQAGTTYYWRVRSYNGNDYSDWTAVESFEVTGNAGSLVPLLTWPLGGAATGTDVDLYWYVNGSSPSISYQVQYASESDFSNAVTVNAGSSTTTQLTGLVPGVIYYWKVRSFNGTVWSSFSVTETFATQAGSSPVRPMGGSPVNSVALTTNNAEFSWFLPSLASGLTYEVQYSQNSDFSNAVTVTNISATSYMANSLPAGAPLYWRVRSKNAAGMYSAYSKAEKFIPNTPTSTEELTVIPTEFALGQNYPNPFNPATVIRFDLPQELYVTVKIYDMLGREVKTLVADTKAAGSYSVQWAGDNNTGSVVAAGTYLYRITAGSFVQTKKMVFLK